MAVVDVGRVLLSGLVAVYAVGMALVDMYLSTVDLLVVVGPLVGLETIAGLVGIVVVAPTAV